jgi:hypothetical protein
MSLPTSEKPCTLPAVQKLQSIDISVLTLVLNGPPRAPFSLSIRAVHVCSLHSDCSVANAMFPK